MWLVLLLVLLPFRAEGAGPTALGIFARFYRVGSVIIGGAHVVLPLLRAEIVPQHWTTDSLFLAGYGAAQALPGPLFSFGAFLGTLVAPHAPRFAYGLLALFGLYLPGWCLIYGALPFWHALRSAPTARAALSGASAGVVGLLTAALYTPIWTSGIHHLSDLLIALGVFLLLQVKRIPVWAAVAAAALAGALTSALFVFP